MAMNTIVTVDINAPVAKVFEASTNFRECQKYITGIVSAEVLTDGPIGNGTRWRETRKMFGKESSEEMTIVGFTPNKSYQVHAESHGSKYNSELTFNEAGGKTTMSMSFSAEPVTMGAKIMTVLTGWMAKGAVSKMMLQDLEDIKKYCES